MYRLTLHLVYLINLAFRLALGLLLFLLLFLEELLVHLVFDVVTQHNGLVHFHLWIGQCVREGQLVGLLNLNDFALVVKGYALRAISNGSW